ncbi:MAG TPA: hypothetical protein VLH10_05030, partial [Yinghuangia sp.]|nr:hypothetical protein [Yinghuangia sp.]
MTLQWQGDLPEPRLDGDTARYPEVVPGADVIVQATRNGFEQFVEIRERPPPCGTSSPTATATRSTPPSRSTTRPPTHPSPPRRVRACSYPASSTRARRPPSSSRQDSSRTAGRTSSAPTPTTARTTTSTGPRGPISSSTPPPPTCRSSIASQTYPEDWGGPSGVAGTFDVTTGAPDANEVLYRLDPYEDDPADHGWTSVRTTGSTARAAAPDASYTVTPAADGNHVMQTRTVDRAGNVGPIRDYGFTSGTRDYNRAQKIDIALPQPDVNAP